jgi:hypothetical protein
MINSLYFQEFSLKKIKILYRHILCRGPGSPLIAVLTFGAPLRVKFSLKLTIIMFEAFHFTK